jgi:hypothetical protein
MKRLICMWGAVAALGLGGCASDRDEGGMTVIHHEGSGAGSSKVVVQEREVPPPPEPIMNPGYHGAGMYYDKFYYNN